MICTTHRLQCKTPHFPKHKFPAHATRNVQTHLKSTVQSTVTVTSLILRLYHVISPLYKLAKLTATMWKKLYS